MEYVIIFLFLFAVLAAAYFYLQRAKRRDAGTTVDADAVRLDKG